MSWDSIKENDSDFTKIEPGKDVRVHILGGDPIKKVSHFVTKGQPPTECIGAGCPSNDHINGDRNHTPHLHESGGYALRQRWI